MYLKSTLEDWAFRSNLWRKLFMFFFLVCSLLLWWVHDYQPDLTLMVVLLLSGCTGYLLLDILFLRPKLRRAVDEMIDFYRRQEDFYESQQQTINDFCIGKVAGRPMKGVSGEDVKVERFLEGCPGSYFITQKDEIARRLREIRVELCYWKKFKKKIGHI